MATSVRPCFLTPTCSRLGYGLLTSVRGMALALQRSGEQVTVLAGRDRYSDEDAALWRGTALHTFRLTPPRALGWSLQLERWLAREARFDVLDIQGVWAGMNASGLRRARRLGARTVLTPHGMLDPWALARSRLKKRVAGKLFADRVLQSVDCFHALTDAEAEALRSLGLRAPIAVIPNGVELPATTAVEPAQGLRLLFLGRLHTKKCVAELVQAWNAVAAEAADWVLQIAGPDELHMLTQLRALARTANVEFLGELHGVDKERAYRRAHAFILPSRSEGLPMTVLEAWAYGLPVVMTAACNLPDGFVSGAALAIEPSVPSIVEGLRALMRLSPDERAAMGARGRALVERAHSWDHTATELACVYRWLQGQAPRPATIRTV
jgi:glycosyltransferase involved in cell wall biosynthesis